MPKRTNDGVSKRCKHSRKGWRDCADPWWFSFYHRGREHRYSLTKLAEARGEKAPVSKEDATTWRDRLRGEIRAGTFVVDPATELPQAAADVRLTVGDVMDLYLDQHVRTADRSKESQVVMTAYVTRLRAMLVPAAQGTTIALASKTLDTVTAADLEVLRRNWTLTTTAARGGKTGPNRALKRLRHFFNWAIEKGHIEKSPFKRAHVNVIHFGKEHGRTRRLEGDEEKRLIDHATTSLIKVLIRAGLETGCRIGELLALTWADVKWDQNALLLPAAITKTHEARDIPITANLRAVLDLRRHAPDGSKHSPDAYVFGNDCGQRVKYWRVNQAWRETCVAAGITGLHFHDLRRELASSLRESGAPDHIVADVLGHANISTTSRYLKASRAGLRKYVAQLEQHRRTTADQPGNATEQGSDDAFAHHSHTGDPAGSPNVAENAVEKPANLLN